MLGAGLIKLRGDPCWRDLTCLVYHYETQPVPNPVSPHLHAVPRWFHMAEPLQPRRRARRALAAPARPLRMPLAGALFVVFQVILILSGNLSFLNWLTIVPALACFDDGVWRRLFPRRVRARVAASSPARGRRASHQVLPRRSSCSSPC